MSNDSYNNNKIKTGVIFPNAVVDNKYNSVCNLSGVDVPNKFLDILNKGLSFVPTPKYLSLSKIKKQHENFIRRIKIHDYFLYQPEFPPKNLGLNIPTSNKLKYPSTWIPTDNDLSMECCVLIKELNNNFDKNIANFKTIPAINGDTKLITSIKPNLNFKDLTSLKQFIISNHIICKKSDKSKSIVILKEDSYVQEVMRQLDDTKYYRPLEAPLQPRTTVLIKSIVDNLFDSKLIDSKQRDFLYPPDPPRPRIFYLLPKIHKPIESWPSGDMPPGRPIISNCGSETNHIAKYIDHFLEPIANLHPSFLKNSYDFKNKICSKNIPTNSYIVTADISSLYTNMRIDLTLEAVRRQFDRYPDPNRPDRTILQLLNIILSRNDFHFNDKIYLQTCGTAMGLSSAPHLANVFLIDFDERAMNYNNKPLFYYRYLDDIFFIFTGSLDELKTFENYLNSLIPGIKLTFNYSLISGDFLDTTVFKSTALDGTTSLKTKIYFKPTDTHQLLHFNSFHPPHVFRSIIKSQILRFFRLSSELSDFETTCKIFFSSIKEFGYSYHLFRSIKRAIKFNVNKNHKKRKNNNNTHKMLPIILDYCPLSSKLANDYKNIIKTFPSFSLLRPITAFHNHPNIGSFVTTSKFISTY